MLAFYNVDIINDFFPASQFDLMMDFRDEAEFNFFEDCEEKVNRSLHIFTTTLKREKQAKPTKLLICVFDFVPDLAYDKLYTRPDAVQLHENNNQQLPSTNLTSCAGK